MQRRDFLKGTGAFAAATSLGLAGCAPKKPLAAAAATAPALPFYDLPPTILPIRAHEDRIFRITVCLRPFRANGPRMDAEKVGDKLVVHNYGHGGSGWSLSWGSARLAVDKALATPAGTDGQRAVAVIGCGALGLTAALTAQRAGARVTIYAKERPPEVRSARATGSWTPDSRIAATTAPASFGDTWEQMARASWSMYQSFLGMPGNPVEYTDRYSLWDGPRPNRDSPKPTAEPIAAPNGAPEFARYFDRIRDISSRSVELPPGTHPFPTRHAYRNSSLTFNVADYSRQLLNDFLLAGGRLETATFNTPQDLAALPQPTLINCTGYGARALWSDESVVPIRGQIAWLIPQEGVHYGLQYNGLNLLARRDGIVIQGSGNPLGEAEGWNDTNEAPDRREAEAGVHILQELYSRMAAMPKPGRI